VLVRSGLSIRQNRQVAVVDPGYLILSVFPARVIPSRFALVTRLIASYTACPYLLTSITFDPTLVNMEGVTQDMPVSHSPPQEKANPSAISVLSLPTEDKGPVPMSFPSILRNSGLTGRYAHLVGPTGSLTVPVQPKRVWRRNDNEGKRWVRRRENGASHFTVHALSLPRHHNTTLEA
jgi:hypothetical protein